MIFAFLNCNKSICGRAVAAHVLAQNPIINWMNRAGRAFTLTRLIQEENKKIYRECVYGVFYFLIERGVYGRDLGILRGHRATAVFITNPWADDRIFNQHSKHSESDSQTSIGSNPNLDFQSSSTPQSKSDFGDRSTRGSASGFGLGLDPPDAWPFISRKLDVRFFLDQNFVPAVLIGDDTPYFRLSRSLVADFAQAIDKLPDSPDRRHAMAILAELRDWLEFYPDQHAEQSRGLNMAAYLAQIRAELKRIKITTSGGDLDQRANGSRFIDLSNSHDKG